jgi:hypothetical protein
MISRLLSEAKTIYRYSDALNELRKSRGVGGKFEHNLVSIDTKAQKATFKTPDGKTVVSMPIYLGTKKNKIRSLGRKLLSTSRYSSHGTTFCC